MLKRDNKDEILDDGGGYGSEGGGGGGWFSDEGGGRRWFGDIGGGRGDVYSGYVGGRDGRDGHGCGGDPEDTESPLYGEIIQ